MKTLAVYVLVCVGIAQIRASAIPDDGNIEEEEMADLTKRSGPCGSGWSEFNGYCYRYIPTPMSWVKAEKRCNSLKAHLASIHDVDEYHFIQNMITQASHGFAEAWIGGSAVEEISTWLWSDGSMFDYVNWCPGQPDFDSQRCLQMNYSDGKCWDNLQCNQKLSFVCSKKIG